MVSHSRRCKYYNLYGTYIVYSMSQCHPGTILSILLVTRTHIQQSEARLLRIEKIGTCIFSAYLSWLPVDHLSDAPRRRLVVTEDSARIQDERTESSTWFSAYSTVAWDLGLKLPKYEPQNTQQSNFPRWQQSRISDFLDNRDRMHIQSISDQLNTYPRQKRQLKISQMKYRSCSKM